MKLGLPCVPIFPKCFNFIVQVLVMATAWPGKSAFCVEDKAGHWQRPPSVSKVAPLIECQMRLAQWFICGRSDSCVKQ